MKRHTIRQFGFGENCYKREFIVETPDDRDPAKISEDTLGRLADEAGAGWEYHDSYDAIIPSEHEMLHDGELNEGLPVVRYDEFATAGVT